MIQVTFKQEVVLECFDSPKRVRPLLETFKKDEVVDIDLVDGEIGSAAQIQLPSGEVSFVIPEFWHVVSVVELP